MNNNDFDVLIKQYIDRYTSDAIPIPVNFRELVSELNKADRYSHSIHSYPAKLISHIPFFFLKTEYFCPKGGVVLDPFCGTGTVLLEALINHKNAYGADANPLARLITDAKTTYISKKTLDKVLSEIVLNAPKNNYPIIPDVGNIDMWFSKSTQRQLAEIINEINYITNKKNRIFFQASFSNLVKKVSFADPRISVPVKLNPSRYDVESTTFKKIENRIKSLENINVYEKFQQICNDNIERCTSSKESLPRLLDSLDVC